MCWQDSKNLTLQVVEITFFQFLVFYESSEGQFGFYFGQTEINGLWWQILVSSDFKEKKSKSENSSSGPTLKCQTCQTAVRPSCKGKVGICEKPIFTSPLPSPAICTEGIPTPASPCSVAIDWLVLPVFQVEATSMPEAMTICQLGHHLGSVIVQHLVSTHLSTLGQGPLEKWTEIACCSIYTYPGETMTIC